MGTPIGGLISGQVRKDFSEFLDTQPKPQLNISTDRMKFSETKPSSNQIQLPSFNLSSTTTAPAPTV